jgi:hypothetical protein
MEGGGRYSKSDSIGGGAGGRWENTPVGGEVGQVVHAPPKATAAKARRAKRRTRDIENAFMIYMYSDEQPPANWLKPAKIKPRDERLREPFGN